MLSNDNEAIQIQSSLYNTCIYIHKKCMCKQLEKFLSVFGGHLTFENIPPRKEQE
jgi:hypothetical protein